MANLIKIDRNGTKYYEGNVPCSRCGGEGLYFIGVCNGKPVPSPVDNGICFKCGGSGVEHSKWKEYTPEYQAKLDAKRKNNRQNLKQGRKRKNSRDLRKKDGLQRKMRDFWQKRQRVIMLGLSVKELTSEQDM